VLRLLPGVLVAMCLAGIMVTQAGMATCVYDDLGRLSQVIEDQGYVATYTKVN